jgi:hypothetical protein
METDRLSTRALLGVGDGRLSLDSDTIEAIARRVAELLHGEPHRRRGESMLTAAAIAERFGVSRSWVYENADRLGAIRLGSGSRARLRFDEGHVSKLLREGGRGPRVGLSGRQTPRRAWVGEADLIPIRGD